MDVFNVYLLWKIEIMHFYDRILLSTKKSNNFTTFIILKHGKNIAKTHLIMKINKFDVGKKQYFWPLSSLTLNEYKNEYISVF